MVGKAGIWGGSLSSLPEGRTNWFLINVVKTSLEGELARLPWWLETDRLSITTFSLCLLLSLSECA
jgi:hypothetical protein